MCYPLMIIQEVFKSGQYSFHTLRTVNVGGCNKQGGLDILVHILNWGVMINGGRWKKLPKRSKIGQKLHEFKRIGTILEIVKINFSKIINWGGHNKLKCLEKNPNFGNYPPPTITVRRVLSFLRVLVYFSYYQLLYVA